MYFILITSNVEIAQFAAARGADWIMVDLEAIGKFERQGHLDTVLSAHTVDDVRRVRSAVPPGRLLVRTNPLHSNSLAELNDVIGAGADMVMLPWFHDDREAAEYVSLVAGRARVILLVETMGAMNALRECCSLSGVWRIHIGLNDLSLELGRRFMFELFVDGTVDAMARVLRDAEMPFGIGGVARIGEGMLAAERILIEHARLGSDASILSRTFHRGATSAKEIEANMDFALEVKMLRRTYVDAKRLSAHAFSENLDVMTETVSAISKKVTDRSIPLIKRR